ncbi:MAG: hypothetical protein OJF62_001829 [Pseudolabrys sp.]|jgi:hypothetical protein|nr:hypothetical protein [Pseudolabrys sp.]
MATLGDDGFLIDASTLGRLLEVRPSDILELMQQKQITSLCERGEGADAGQYRLSFFYKGRRARLYVDEAGTVIRSSAVNIGDGPLPAALRRPGSC